MDEQLLVTFEVRHGADEKRLESDFGQTDVASLPETVPHHLCLLSLDLVALRVFFGELFGLLIGPALLEVTLVFTDCDCPPPLFVFGALTL